jgi:hypothetical protein
VSEVHAHREWERGGVCARARSRLAVLVVRSSGLTGAGGGCHRGPDSKYVFSCGDDEALRERWVQSFRACDVVGCAAALPVLCCLLL